jgi:hypothetical protein
MCAALQAVPLREQPARHWSNEASFDQVSEFCGHFGITTQAEAAAEAKKSADNNDTDWEGYNHTDCYTDVSDSDTPNLAEHTHDPNNGHLQNTTAAARAHDRPSKQQNKRRSKQQSDRSQHSKQQGSARRGSSSGADSSRAKNAR